MEKNVPGKNIFRLAAPFLASAVLLTVIQAPLNLWPVAWVALVPFIVACSPQKPPRQLILIPGIIALFLWRVCKKIL